jgi:hypothetical protein
MDASSVTEEFREKLQMMPSERVVVDGTAVLSAPASALPPRQK